MCGRYASTRSAADLAELFGAEDLTDGDLVPAYNVAPTDPAPVVRISTSRGATVLGLGRWGLVPAWSPDGSGTSDGGARAGVPRARLNMINARAETVATSRAFSDAFARRRCLVPADGWFEWRRTESAGPRTRRSGQSRQPFFLTRPEGVVFGGIWSVSGTQRRLTFSIITLPAVGPLATVHDRMPMVLDASRWEQWLRAEDPNALLTPPTSDYCEGFELRPVSAAVGDVRKDGPELLQRVIAPTVD